MKLLLTHYGRMLVIGTLLMSLAACQVQPPSAFVTATPSSPSITSGAGVTSASAAETDSACKDYSNIKGGPSDGAYFWRFHLAFNTDPTDLAGCLLIRRAGQSKAIRGERVPCQLNVAQSSSSLIHLEQVTVTTEVPALPAAGAPDPTRALTYTVLAPGQFISCTFNLNTVFGTITPEITAQSAYTYSYFSLSALTYLTTSQPYKGTLVDIQPTCMQSESDSRPCMHSSWEIQGSDEITNAVNFITNFNGDDAEYSTPEFFTYDPALIQGWWVGIRSQYDRIVNTDTIKLEHLHDQSRPIPPGSKVNFRHQTTTYGRKFGADTVGRLVAFSGDSVTIYIGGSPDEPAKTFNGGILQIMIDPSGGSSPDGGM